MAYMEYPPATREMIQALMGALINRHPMALKAAHALWIAGAVAHVDDERLEHLTGDLCEYVQKRLEKEQPSVVVACLVLTLSAACDALFNPDVTDGSYRLD